MDEAGLNLHLIVTPLAGTLRRGFYECDLLRGRLASRRRLGIRFVSRLSADAP